METIQTQLINLGINPGDVILMHSSMKALETTNTPETFLSEILEYLTKNGTLLLPALTYKNVSGKNLVFSIVDSEPCIGLLPKTFQKMDGVVRSMHPTHSVCAYGLKAENLTMHHYKDDTPVGPNSPFMLLTEYNGKILFVGDVVNSCTFMHGIEEIVGTPYTLNDEMTRYTLIDKTGDSFDKDYYTHNFTGWRQEYYKICDILTSPDIQTGKIYNADCTLIDAQALKRNALPKFKHDIYSFVSRA